MIMPYRALCLKQHKLPSRKSDSIRPGQSLPEKIRGRTGLEPCQIWDPLPRVTSLHVTAVCRACPPRDRLSPCPCSQFFLYRVQHFPCELVSIHTVRPLTRGGNLQGTALSSVWTRSAPYARRSTARRSTSRGGPRTTSRCMRPKHPWRLRSAWNPILLNGNEG